MSKQSTGLPPAAGLASLAAEGITSAALESGTIPEARLAEILAAGSDASLALAHLLGDIQRSEHAALLAGAEGRVHGAVRREVRRALYRLGRAGIEPSPPAAPAPAAAAADARAEADGWLSHVDGRGDCLVWITKPVSGGLLFISARVNDQEGLGDLTAGETSRRQFRLRSSELRDRHGLRMVGVDWRYADALLAAASARGTPASGPAYPTVRRQLTNDPPAAPEPPIYRHVARDAVDSALAGLSAELLEAPELGSWLPRPADLEPYVRDILAARDSPLVLNRYQQEERVTAILERAARDLFPPGALAPRLEAMAYFFWQTARERQARVALAAAQALTGGTLPHAVPILDALLRQSLATAYEGAQAQAQDAERTSVIVKPTGDIRARSLSK
jgi:hypothetical protein